MHLRFFTFFNDSLKTWAEITDNEAPLKWWVSKDVVLLFYTIYIFSAESKMLLATQLDTDLI